MQLTFVHVTHDQEEAVTMADVIVVMNRGRIEQLGTPAELYEQPRTAFVAGFVGISNLLAGDLAKRIAGSAKPVSVRPEKIHLEPASAGIPDQAQSTAGRVESILYLGANTRYLVALEGGGELTVLLPNRDAHFDPAQGDQVRLWWEPRHLMRFEA